MSDFQIPPMFAKHSRRSGLTDPWEPLYSRYTAQAVHIGLRAGAAHANGRGFVHGGLLTALADNAMGLSCGQLRGDDTVSLVTINAGQNRVRHAGVR